MIASWKSRGGSNREEPEYEGLTVGESSLNRKQSPCLV